MPCGSRCARRKTRNGGVALWLALRTAHNSPRHVKALHGHICRIKNGEAARGAIQRRLRLLNDWPREASVAIVANKGLREKRRH